MRGTRSRTVKYNADEIGRVRVVEDFLPAPDAFVPMPHYLLTGAGFSRNWGGWLANEAFEYLLGAPEIDDHLRNVLWGAKLRGEGFEGALSMVQGAYASNKSDRNQTAFRQAHASGDRNVQHDAGGFQ